MTERPDTLIRGETARLIPITADSNKEVRATSILLATLTSVPVFAHEVLSSIGQRVGTRANLACFTEVQFKKEKETNIRPDGLLTLDNGRGRTWQCLIETKVGNTELTADQIEKYLGLAKRNNVDSVLTLSNQFVARPDHLPVKIPKMLLRSTTLYHWSWIYLLTTAKLLLDEGKFETNEQRYILREFVRYFDHPSSGVSRFDRMNTEWKEVCSQVISRAALNKSSVAIENTVAAWHQESRDICLLMSERLNRPVRLHLTRAHEHDPLKRLKEDCEHLAKQLELKCTLAIPDAASPLVITANLRTRVISATMTLAAPKDKQRATSRINWLLRQLVKSNPDDIHIRANWPGRTPSTQARLADVRENPEMLIQHSMVAPISFDILLIKDIAGKFSGMSTFIEHLEAAVPHFYSEVGQRLRQYIPPAPALKNEEGSNDQIDDPVREKQTEESMPQSITG